LGLDYADAEQTLHQEVFDQQRPPHLLLVTRIRQLEQERTGTSPEEPFIELLEGLLRTDETKRMREVAVDWGRYGEVQE
jgi:NitT/TauT family transport system ATP-binding protein